MKKLLFLLLALIITTCIHAGTIQTWVGTGFSPIKVGLYPENDVFDKWVVTASPSNPLSTWFPMMAWEHKDWLYVANATTVYKSWDGKKFIPVTNMANVSLHANYYSVESFNGKMWHMGDGNGTNVISYSDDGALWTAATYPAYLGTYGKMFKKDNYLWAFAGNGTIAKSPDGYNWTIVTTSPPWGTSNNAGAGCVWNNKFVYQAKMFGGTTTYYYSNDCITWTTNNGPQLIVNQPGYMFTYGPYLIVTCGYYYWSKYTIDGAIWTDIPTPYASRGLPFCTFKSHILTYQPNGPARRSSK